MIRFKLNIDKIIEGMQLLAEHQPGITQYYVGKVFFFADKEHFLDWGRSISGDRYVAMEHGPVPSTIYDLIKDSGGEPDDIIDKINNAVSIHTDGNKRKIFSTNNKLPFNLSKTDKEYLLRSLKEYGKMSFGNLRDISHRDAAWAEAWREPGLNNEMDSLLWLENYNQDIYDQFIENPSILHVSTPPTYR